MDNPHPTLSWQSRDFSAFSGAALTQPPPNGTTSESTSHISTPKSILKRSPPKNHSSRSSASSQKGVIIADGISIPSRGNVGPSKRSSAAFGSIHTNPIPIDSPTSEPSTSIYDSPIPSILTPLSPKPTKIDIDKFFQGFPPLRPLGAPQTSSNLSPLGFSPSFNTSAYPTTPPTSSYNLQTNITTTDPGTGSKRTSSSSLPSQPQSPALLRQAHLVGGMTGGVGVGNRPPPRPRISIDTLLTPALREALNASITSGSFVDTKIYLFSHHNSAGEICKPKALYANTVVLKSVPYFDDLFSGNYSESAMKDLDEDTADEDEIAQFYDYDSDSDLEDAEDLDTADGPDNDCATTDRSQDTNRDGYTSAYYKERVKEGRVIKIQDVAFITFQAFLLYLYTGCIEFAPFGSKDNRKSRAAEIISLAPDRVPRPSPKSIYRLADKYDVPTLKYLALARIKEELKECNPIRETFSRFASHYPEILKIHVENLASILTEGNSGEVQDQMDERLQALSEGEADHASEAFSSLWRRLVQNEGGKIPRSTHSNFPFGTPSPVESSPLTIALIKSIQQGTFCDRRYMAKREDTGRWRSPIYISSIVLGDIEWDLNDLVTDLEGEMENLEVGYDSDSDYEGIVEGATSCDWGGMGSRSEQKSRSTTAAALSTGAFLTWRALFFYLYTGYVRFSPLKSAGLEKRAQYMGANQKPENPPPCSPKSVCYLAEKLGLSHLETTALGDATAKTSIANIVKETFSKSTARLPRLREVQCQLLLSSSKNEGIVRMTEEHIRCLAGGQTSHRYGALSLGLRMAIKAKHTIASGNVASPPHVPNTIQVPGGNLDLHHGTETRPRRGKLRLIIPTRTGAQITMS